MNFKRHWDDSKEGFVKIYETKNSACNLMEAYALMLKREIPTKATPKRGNTV